MPRRILIITNRVPFPLKDGGAMAMDAMIRGYHQSGWKVFLLAMNTSRHHVPQKTLDTLYRELYAFETVDTDNRLRTVPLIRNLLLSDTPAHADRFYTADFRERLTEILQRFEPHVIQLESIYLNTYLETFRQYSQALLVQRLHNIECQIWKLLAGETRHPLKRWYLHNLAGRIKRFEQDAWADADLLLPITAADAAVVHDSGCHTPMHITPFGIGLGGATAGLSGSAGGYGRTTNAGASSGLPSSAHHLPGAREGLWHGYHIGAMDWRPNQDAMTWFVREIWPEVYRQVPAFRFSFAGRVMPDRLRRDLPQGVSCKGEVPDADAFIRDKHILIVPLRSGGGIRVKILEAMAAGKLVISTATGMQGIEAEPDIHYLRADTPAAFVAQIKKAVTDPAAALEIAGQGQALIHRYHDRDRIMNGLITRLEQILAEDR